MTTKKKRIRVTQQDIDAGERQSFESCPLANAVARVFRKRPVAVRHEGVFIGKLDDSLLWVAALPANASRFISNFDAGRNVKPTEFDLVFK